MGQSCIRPILICQIVVDYKFTITLENINPTITISYSVIIDKMNGTIRGTKQ